MDKKFPDKLPITLIVITFNEESCIERCLKSASFCNEIIVVDSFSTDRTQSLAENCGARVYAERWRGYGPQKKLATALTQNDWILSLDADEALSPELKKEIIEKFHTFDIQTAYKIPRKSFYLNRWIHHGGWYPDYQLRLYNKKYSNWPDSDIHERLEAPRESSLSHNILHWVFDDISDQVLTNDKYSTLQTRNLEKQNKRFSILKLLTKPLTKFVELYLWKRGFLDGLPGFIIAVNGSYSVFLKWAKLWEIQTKSHPLPKKDSE